MLMMFGALGASLTDPAQATTEYAMEVRRIMDETPDPL